MKIKTEPKNIVSEYQKGTNYKASLGDRGIYEQSRMNERFFCGDQWHGAKCGNSRPLVRRNVIKRIGEYKMSMIAASPLSVNYSADGVPNTNDIIEQSTELKEQMFGGGLPEGEVDSIEVSAVTGAMSDYFATTAERIKFEDKKEQMLRNAYVSGTGILFTYWDSDIKTGLYADEAKRKPINGDIDCEVIDVENVVFGDPNLDDVSKQPYIIISQRRDVEEVKREARQNRLPYDDIKPDGYGANMHYNAGDLGENEPTESRRVTVYTKFYKEYDKSDSSYKVMAVRCTEKAYIRRPWDLKIKSYPIAKFSWERRRSSIYGESEITYLIPNQIAINRIITAAVWGLMSNGMPIMLVNGDTVSQDITNDPGQIIKIYGSNEDVAGAVHYAQCPNLTPQFQSLINDLCQSTLSDTGANEAALGDIRPDNASAIIQIREAARQPMQLYLNRFYGFVEDVARIWADFWINMYGDRSLKVNTRNGTEYMRFQAYRYKNLVVTAKVDVGADTVYSSAVIIQTLDALYQMQLLTPQQYLERLPAGIVPDKNGLLEDLKQAQAAPNGDIADEDIIMLLQQQYPEQYERFAQLSPEEQQRMLAEIRANMLSTGGEAAPQGEAQVLEEF